MIDYIITYYGNQIIGAVLCAVAALLGVAAKNIWKNHVNDSIKYGVARSVVLCVEQIWREIHGEKKLRKALELAEKALRAKKIPFDADEMMIHIEAAVAEFNGVFYKDITPATCGYAYDGPTEGSTESMSADTEWKDMEE